MTVLTSGSKLRLLKRGEVITAEYLNDIAAKADRNARTLDEITTEVPEGEDGAGTEPPAILTELPGTAVFGAPHRIEDASDPTVYIEIRNKIEIYLVDQNGNSVTLMLEDTAPP